jgi:hypothetical protein
VFGAPFLFAYITLSLCPLVSLVIVALFRAPIAVPIIILAGQMFLPPMVAFDAPLIPPLDKAIVAQLSALFACAIIRPKSLRGARPGRGYDLFILLLIAGYFGTYLTNRDPVQFGPTVLPGLTFHDVLSDAVTNVLYWWPPFFLGRALYRNPDDLKKLFVILAAAGIAYTPFLIIEMKMSPQLNMWFYGFHQSEFIQTIRGGHYRPKVFMRHGLTLALFMVFTLLAAAALAKLKQRVMGVKAGIVVLFLLVFVILCRSAGAITYAAIFLPLLWFARVRTQARWAAVLAVILFSYPLCRALGLIPVDNITAFFLSAFGEERAGSLAYRLNEESLILARALPRIIFGWGGYGRPFPHDPWSGKELFNVDGLAVIQIGTRGIVGFFAIYAMLLLPAWRARRTLAKMIASPREKVLVACLALMTVLYVADTIPNSGIDPYLTFLVGVLVGTERGFDQASLPGYGPRLG